MAVPLPEKLRCYLRQAGSWLETKRQFVCARWRGHTTSFYVPADAPEMSPDALDLSDVLDGTVEAMPSVVPELFVAQLKAVAAKAHSTEVLPGQLHERSSVSTGRSWFSHRRDYLVYVPSDYDGREASPVVVVLHGCRQTHQDIRAISGFDAIAERERFIVVYPFVTRYWSPRNRNCWAWWMSQHINAGSGEVEDIARIVQQVQDEFSVDPQRIHITGLSSGAGMAVAALVAHGQLFASGASVAGVAYGESARSVRITPLLMIKYRSLAYIVERMRAQLSIAGRGRLAPLLVVQSEADETVEMQSGLNLRDSWLAVHDVDISEVQHLEGQTRGIRWQYEHYGELVGFLTTEQLPHGWVGGLPGEYSDARGPNISEVIWLYFKDA
uniref:Poly(3-hydroxybutyrate) depolymerase n=1 Tax=uncultured Thiotrichaceae bacterium TaxID=298394 RepID=A0A6S6TY20_9GAMM|nr:MAG: Unknown protein [uncultured Thiotrichaceae bacterium]